jgi:hypothetical protein
MICGAANKIFPRADSELCEGIRRANRVKGPFRGRIIAPFAGGVELNAQTLREVAQNLRGNPAATGLKCRFFAPFRSGNFSRWHCDAADVATKGQRLN